MSKIVLIKKKKKKTVKQLNRNKKREDKIFEKKQIDALFLIYNQYSEKEIHDLVIYLTDPKSMVDDSNEVKRQAVKRVIENKLYEKTQEDIVGEESFFYYPDFTDKDFNLKIYKKKEFNENQINFNTYNIEDLSKERCDDSKFELSQTQNFIKNFISPYTPYNGILLFYGTGVGKTCSAISIAEQFKKTIRENGKKIIVLLSPSIKDNFKRKIFNIDKLDIENLDKDIPQCTGNDYLKEVDFSFINEKEQFNRKINKIINKYYQFFGYDEFAYYVEKLEDNICKGFPKDRHSELKRKIIEKKFSNIVLIVDEAHNIRLNGDNSSKIAPPIIERVIKYAKNTKLILLTATPMYNSISEIIWIINLLLQNDNRPIIYNNEIFKKSGDLKESGLDILIRKSRGYVSFMRGENPFSFPFRLYPDINKDSKILVNSKISIKDMSGKDILEKDKIKYLTLVNSQMSNFQYSQYEKSVPLLMKNKDIYSESRGYSEIEKGLQVSNITYPSLYGDKLKYGKSGIETIFDIDNHKKFKYKKDVFEKFGSILDLDKIGDYSCKIKSIIEYINNSEGIVYVYSQFITSGILPLALALEQNGYKKYGNEEDQLLDLPNYKKGNNCCKRESISYEGKHYSEYKKKKDFIQAKYVLISGNSNISKNNNFEINLSTLKSNKGGEVIKVILGSPLAGEGLDLKGIREVHILEPWHHLNKMSQVIGRAIRTCSHKFLPLTKRNCTVYLHVSTTFQASKNIKKEKNYCERESLDLRIYRKAEFKSLQIAVVERELKKNAVDCELNKKGNIYLPSQWNQKVKIITSQGKNEIYTIGDKPYSLICNYQKECNYDCNPNISEKDKIEVDIDTYDFHFAKKHILKICRIIKNLFKKDFVYVISEIISEVKKKLDISNILIYKSIDEMLKNKIIFLDKYQTKGYLIFKNGYYIFQPNNIKDESLPFYYRKIPQIVRKLRVPLKNNIYIQEMEYIKDKQKSIIHEKLTFQNIKVKVSDQVEKNIKIYSNDDYWKGTIDILKDIEFEKMFDRLSDNYKSFLINEIIINYNDSIESVSKIEEIFDTFQLKVFNYFYEDLLFINKHLYYGEKIWEGNKQIFGFRLATPEKKYKYYCIKNKKYEECKSISLKHIVKSLSLIPKEKIREGNTIFGFMDRMKNPRINVFKIVDRRFRKSSGARCEQINSKKEIGNLINIILEKTKYLIQNKGVPFLNGGKNIKKDKTYMCSELETLLRIKDKNSAKQFFYNTNEIIK
jgi:hypothetical protein